MPGLRAHSADAADGLGLVEDVTHDYKHTARRRCSPCSKLTRTELIEHQRQACARNRRADSARHARLILLLFERLNGPRAKLDCSDSHIDRWSKRFVADRLAGLLARHAGRERDEVTDRVDACSHVRTNCRKSESASSRTWACCSRHPIRCMANTAAYASA